MQKLKLKESVSILEEPEDIYQCVFTSTRRMKRFKVDRLVKDAINFLKEERETKEVFAYLSSNGHELDNIQSCLASLQASGVVYGYDTKHFNERNKRQLLFLNELTKSWEETVSLQRKLEETRITVLGTGGIGTWVINGLYQLGMKSIQIVDPDIVEESNLNRQLFFNSSDIGKYKVDTLKEKLIDCQIETSKEYVSDEANLEDLLKESDFIVNCTDNPSVHETTKIVSKYAAKFKIPFSAAGGYNMHLGMVGPIFTPESTCFDCFIDYQKNKETQSSLKVIKGVEQSGNLGPIAGVIANLHVMDIFKHLIGKGDVRINKYSEIDFISMEIKNYNFSKRLSCDCNQNKCASIPIAHK